MDPIKSFMVPSEKFITVDRDTDMVRRVVAAGVDTLTTTAEKIMSAPILTIEEDKTVLDVSDLMANTHIRHLGVTQGGKLVGMISVRDILVFLTNLRKK